MDGQRPLNSIEAIFGKAKVAIGVVIVFRSLEHRDTSVSHSPRSSTERLPMHQLMWRAKLMG